MTFVDRPGEHPRRPATDEELRVLASTLRLRVLRICLHEPHTNKEVAEALGKDPATVLHHVRRLVDTGFLTAQPARRGTRGAREIPYLATGKSWRLDFPPTDRLLLDTFLEEVSLVPVEQVHTMRVGLLLTDGLREEFEERMRDLVEEYRARTENTGDGRAWSLFLAVHPDPNRP
ncbi:ArsR/SmtB family transcription factor [Jatrophihabitans endophyticus]|nr:winged helix-turn-helix domain-containing protein [Jatrophihabitans endophyticus]